MTADKHERCPTCNARTVLRSGPHGPFVGCSAFPQCRWSRSTNRPTRGGSSDLAGDWSVMFNPDETHDFPSEQEMMG